MGGLMKRILTSPKDWDWSDIVQTGAAWFFLASAMQSAWHHDFGYAVMFCLLGWAITRAKL
jgi:hypothetical protein